MNHMAIIRRRQEQSRPAGKIIRNISNFFLTKSDHHGVYNELQQLVILNRMLLEQYISVCKCVLRVHSKRAMYKT